MERAPDESQVWRSELDPVDFLRRAEVVYGPKTGLVHEDGRRYAWAEIAERSWRLANALRALGLGRHDRVAVLSPNAPLILEAHFAAPAAGLQLVAINTRLAGAEIDYILQHSGARALLVDHELLPLVEPLALDGVAVVRCDDSGRPDCPYETLLAGASPDQPERWLEDEEEPISINYTSGTTGRPKGVQYTYRGAYLNALSECVVAGLQPESTYLWTLPMFHCNGWCFPWAVTAVGATHVTMRKVDSAEIWRLIDEEGVTHYNGAPTVQLSVANHPRAHPVERPVTALVAAAPPSPTLFARMAELNFRTVHVYGLTETYGPITVSPWLPDWDVAARPTSRPACARARARATRPPISCASSTSTTWTSRATAPRWARSSCAATTSCAATSRTRRRRRRVPQRLVPLRRPGGVASRRQRRAPRPRQGHHHLGRREHLHHRGRAGRRPRTRPCWSARSWRRRTSTGASGRRRS